MFINSFMETKMENMTFDAGIVEALIRKEIDPRFIRPVDGDIPTISQEIFQVIGTNPMEGSGANIKFSTINEPVMETLKNLSEQ